MESRTDTKLSDEVGRTLIWGDRELCQITLVPPLAHAHPQSLENNSRSPSKHAI